jgi:dienelactone hydrolase
MEDLQMPHKWLRFLILIALTTSIALTTAAVAVAQQSNACRDSTQDGPLGDFYKIPVDDPETTSILGWLSKPKGPGPFPAVVLFPPCGGIQNSQLRMFSRIIEGLGPKGFATLVIDSYAPRHIDGGVVCATPQRFNMLRASADSYAALNFLVTMPDIDSKRIFVEGFSHGGSAAINTIYAANAAQQRHKFAGAIGYYPYCRADAKFSVPTLILIGDKDDWTPVDLCQSIKGKRNVELVVYPGVTHAFNQPGVRDVLGHHLVYDEAATADAQSRAEAFLTAHLRR